MRIRAEGRLINFLIDLFEVNSRQEMSVEEVLTNPPPKPDDVPLRIYSNPICPYAQRARLIAAAKGIKHEVINVHLKKKPAWFLSDINPYGLVPVIEHNGHIIRESAVVFDYIDEVFGVSKLWPTDPYKRAQTRLLLNDFGAQFTPNYYKYFFNKADENAPITILKFLKFVESVITENGGPYIIGKELSAIDLLLWPWFERLQVFADEIPALKESYSIDKVPLIFKWVEQMLTVEAVKNTQLSAEAHKKFFKSAKSSGTHDYSMADTTGKGIKIYCS